MRVLGVDPGLSRCGVGVLSGSRHRPEVVRVGVVRTPTGEPVSARLAQLHAELTALLDETRPDAVAVERVLFNSNARTAMGVGQAAGVVLLCAAQAGVPAVEYTPTQVKATVTGSGRADKEQVAYMVRVQLGLAQPPTPADAADALALALCHLQRGGAAGSAEGVISPRLAAAIAAARPGAQVTQTSPAGARPSPSPAGARPST
ncbi:MAG: crossover junction endodeoxyribonuclease RuvC [Egibacteraceae bacterium]